MKKVLIAGLGISGYEAALLALSQDLKVHLIDTRNTPALKQKAAELKTVGVDVTLGFKAYDQTFEVDAIVLSPGIHPRESFGQYLQTLNAELMSELEFSSRFCPSPLIGITGTNGKTTTVELITHCLNSLGKRAVAAGNIGYALSRVVREAQDWDYIVVEVSSFQLEFIQELHFISGALLNISSDHVDRYRDDLDYAQTKLKLLKQSKFKTVNQNLIEEFPKACQHALAVSYQEESLFSLNNDQRLVTPEGLYDYREHSLKGYHNAENLLSCFSVLFQLGFDISELYRVSRLYKTGAHRLQFFLKSGEIIFINDSKATNPDALRMALESVGDKERKNIILIAGGRDKKMDFKVVNSALCSYVRKLFIYGEFRYELDRLWSPRVSCEVWEDFKDAVEAAIKSAEAGDVLLLSPGCSSLDSFSNYAERGEVFMEIVQEWTKE